MESEGRHGARAVWEPEGKGDHVQGSEMRSGPRGPYPDSIPSYFCRTVTRNTRCEVVLLTVAVLAVPPSFGCTCGEIFGECENETTSLSANVYQLWACLPCVPPRGLVPLYTHPAIML